MSTDDDTAEDVLNSDTEPSIERKWDDLDDEERHALLSLAKKLKADDPKQAAKNAVSRRAFLGAGATVGAGLLGAAAGRASAGSQSAGTIGTEADPADFWSEDNYIKSQSGDPSAPSSSDDIVFYNKNGAFYQRDGSGTVSTFGGDANIASELNGGNLVAISDGETSEVIDPGSTSTPLVDAANAATSGGSGKVLVPPGGITVSGQFDFAGYDGLTIEGPGRPSWPYGARLTWNSDVTGITWTSNVEGIGLKNLILDGPGLGTSTNPAIEQAGQCTNSVFDGLVVYNWDRVWSSVSNLFVQSEIRWLQANECDPGGSNPMMEVFAGQGATAGTLALYPAPDATGGSGTDSDALKVESGSFVLDELNCGRGTARSLYTTAEQTVVQRINHEANQQQSSQVRAVQLAGTGGAFIGTVRMHAGTVDYVVDMVTEGGGDSTAGDAANKHVGPVIETGGTINTTLVRAASQSGPLVYHGLSSDVTVSGTLSPGVNCLGDATLKTS